jgi:hypothetical protein
VEHVVDFKLVDLDCGRLKPLVDFATEGVSNCASECLDNRLNVYLGKKHEDNGV